MFAIPGIIALIIFIYARPQEFLERLRGERRFESAEALIEQMGRDVQRTREIAAAAS